MANRKVESEAAPQVNGDVLANARVALAQSQLAKRDMRIYYENEKKVAMYLSPMYQPYFSKVMNVAINGVHIYFPVDGSTHMIPATFASEIARRRMSVDAILQKQNRMATVTNNAEGSPGELSLF